MNCTACSNTSDFEYKGKPYCYPHYLAQIAFDPPPHPKRERADDQRQLQYMLNVLLHADVFKYEIGDDGSAQYTAHKLDPYFIEDDQWREMCKAFDLSTGAKPQQTM